ncbi:MAG: hypothetical protein ACKO9G_02535, partial [Dolichospermum sp.]
TALSGVMRYTTGGQDAHPTRVLLLKFVPHSNGICCNSQLVGCLSYGAEMMDNISYLKLHKCYLLPSLHGFGYGQKMLFDIYQKVPAMNLKQKFSISSI